MIDKFEFQKLRTSDELSAFMTTYRIALIKGTVNPSVSLGMGSILSRPSEFFIDIPSEFKERLDYYILLSGLIGDGVSQILSYQALRDQIQAYQVRECISALTWEERTIRGQDLKWLGFCDQLTLLEADKIALAQAKDETVEIFRKLGYSLPSLAYILVRSDSDNNEDSYTPCEWEEVVFIANQCRHADLGSESIEWEQDEQRGCLSGTFVEKENPDKIFLFLSIDPADISSLAQSWVYCWLREDIFLEYMSWQ